MTTPLWLIMIEKTETARLAGRTAKGGNRKIVPESRDMKEKLLRGELLLGTMVTAFDSPEIIRLAANAGLDWVFVDTESVYPDPARLAAMLGYAQMAGLPAVVRIPEISKAEVSRVLDLGAAGIICPDVRSAAEARELVRLAKYAPEGERGVALERPHTRYLPGSTEDKLRYMEEANRRLMLICQIESLQGLERLQEIVETPGVDGLLIGPNDLTQAMGIYGQLSHPDFLRAVDRVVAAAQGCGKYVGMSCGSAAACRPWAEMGVRFFQVGTDTSLYAGALREMSGQWRQTGEPASVKKAR